MRWWAWCGRRNSTPRVEPTCWLGSWHESPGSRRTSTTPSHWNYTTNPYSRDWTSRASKWAALTSAFDTHSSTSPTRPCSSTSTRTHPNPTRTGAMYYLVDCFRACRVSWRVHTSLIGCKVGNIILIGLWIVSCEYNDTNKSQTIPDYWSASQHTSRGTSPPWTRPPSLSRISPSTLRTTNQSERRQ